jgi:hypothetical protein
MSLLVLAMLSSIVHYLEQKLRKRVRHFFGANPLCSGDVCVEFRGFVCVGTAIRAECKPFPTLIYARSQERIGLPQTTSVPINVQRRRNMQCDP